MPLVKQASKLCSPLVVKDASSLKPIGALCFANDALSGPQILGRAHNNVGRDRTNLGQSP